MASESSVLSLIRSSPIVVFVTSKCNATSCSFCRKAIEELTNTGYDHAVIVATVEEHAVSQFFHLNVLKDSRCCNLLLTVRCSRYAPDYNQTIRQAKYSKLLGAGKGIDSDLRLQKGVSIFQILAN